MKPRTVDYFLYTGQWLLDMVFPAHCLGCQTLTNARPRRYLCNSCERKISIRHSFECIGCKVVAPGGATCRLCVSANAVDQLFIASHYQDPVLAQLLKTYKYQFVSDISNHLIRVLDKYISWVRTKKDFSVFADNPLITAVPLHPYRQRWRGFNQAEILARAIANQYQMNYADVLTRKQIREAQANLENRDERITNLQGVFDCPDPASIQGRTITLVDDICTTGTTLNECAKVLKQNGARKVMALVVARG